MPDNDRLDQDGPVATNNETSRERGPQLAPPLIFISHDTRDAELAEAFSKLLASVSAGVLKTFRSSDNRGSQGIEYGVDWYPEIMRKLDVASDVVCLLTQRSINRPWILYEAGVAKGKLNTPVYGVALGVPLNTAGSGPFAQFQNCDDDEESLTKLLMQLLRRIPGSEPERDAVLTQVRAFKERVGESLKQIAAKDADPPDKSEPIAVSKLFEEIKIMFNDLPQRISTMGYSPTMSRGIKNLHPLILQDLAMAIGGSSSDPITILVMLAPFQLDVPWLYTLGLDVYQAIRQGHEADAEQAIQRLRSALNFIAHGQAAESFRLDTNHFLQIAAPLIEKLIVKMMVSIHGRRQDTWQPMLRSAQAKAASAEDDSSSKNDT